jgi:hypothetical protein
VQFGGANVDSSKMGMSEEELQLNTRKEIMDLGERLGKTTIAAWASKEERATANFANVPADKALEIDTKGCAYIIKKFYSCIYTDTYVLSLIF